MLIISRRGCGQVTPIGKKETTWTIVFSEAEIRFSKAGIGFSEAEIRFSKAGIEFSEVGIVFSYNSYNYHYYTPTKLVLCVGGGV